MSQIRLNNPVIIKDFYNEIQISDDETKIKMSVEQAKELFKQLEDTLFDGTESHRYMQNKILELEIALDKKERPWI